MNQCLLYGDNREYNVLIVVPDFAQLRAWVAKYLPQVPFSGESPENDRLLLEVKEVQDLLSMEIQTAVGVCKVDIFFILSNYLFSNSLYYSNCSHTRDPGNGPLFLMPSLRRITC